MQQVEDFLFITFMIVTVQAGVWFDSDVMVEKLNAYRKTHDANSLNLNEDLTLKSCCVAYSLIDNTDIPFDINEYGMSTYWFENIAIASVNVETTVKTVTETWYSEGVNYNFLDEPLDKESAKNFTQILWKNTENIGAGISSNDEKAVVVVLYSPKGNQTNQYVNNIGSPIDEEIPDIN